MTPPPCFYFREQGNSFCFMSDCHPAKHHLVYSLLAKTSQNDTLDFCNHQKKLRHHHLYSEK